MLIFYKRNKRLVPPPLLSYISTSELLRTLEKFEKVSPTAHASLSTSVVFLKIPAWFNSPMHSTRLFFLYYHTADSDVKQFVWLIASQQ